MEVPAPQLTIGPDGNLVIDEKSLVSNPNSKVLLEYLLFLFYCRLLRGKRLEKEERHSAGQQSPLPHLTSQEAVKKIKENNGLMKVHFQKYTNYSAHFFLLLFFNTQYNCFKGCPVIFYIFSHNDMHLIDKNCIIKCPLIGYLIL